MVLYTGGTMGMKTDENGRLSPVPGYLTEQIHAMVNLHLDDNLPNVNVSIFFVS
jgi:hypothetical protein